MKYNNNVKTFTFQLLKNAIEMLMLSKRTKQTYTNDD